MHSGSSFWNDLVAIFTRAKHPELCCCKFITWACDKMGGGGGGGGGGGAQPPLFSKWGG